MQPAKQLIEEAFFFGDREAPNFGTLHAPASLSNDLRVGVVLCPPIAHEFDFAQRIFIEWARDLAKIGLWVLRFDYRGHGDSGGAFSQYDLTEFAEDVRRAIDVLEQRAGVPCYSLCGMRLGATVAAQVWADDNRPGPLILCEPIIRGQQYLDELLLALLVKNMKENAKPGSTRAELKQLITEGKTVFFEGRPISRRLAQSLEALNLERECSRLSKSTLFVEIRKKARAAPDLKFVRLRDDLRRRCRSDLTSVTAPPPWFGSLILDYSGRVSVAELFKVTRNWLIADPAVGMPTGEFPSDASLWRPIRDSQISQSSQLPPVWVSTAAGLDRPIQFDVDGLRCTGMFHSPERIDPDRPVIVMPPQGMNARTGWNQLHVRLARALGKMGWASIRFDARGLGHSEGQLDFATGADLFFAVENGLHVRDTSRVIDWVERELGIRSVVLLGVCGGAVTTGLLAVDDTRIAATAFIELPLRYSRHPTQRDGKPIWRYREALFSAQAWRKFLTLRADYRLHVRSLGLAAANVLRLRSRSGLDGCWLVNQLGETANVPLANSIRHCCRRGLPMLFVFGSTEDAAFFQRVRSALCPADSKQITHRVVHGADHDFLLPQHSHELSEIVGDWLKYRFPCNK